MGKALAILWLSGPMEHAGGKRKWWHPLTLQSSFIEMKVSLLLLPLKWKSASITIKGMDLSVKLWSSAPLKEVSFFILIFIQYILIFYFAIWVRYYCTNVIKYRYTKMKIKFTYSLTILFRYIFPNNFILKNWPFHICCFMFFTFNDIWQISFHDNNNITNSCSVFYSLDGHLTNRLWFEM